MGQYYQAIIFTQKTERVFNPHSYGEGCKLIEQSSDSDGVVFEIYKLMYNSKKRIIWLGDYARQHPLYKPEYDRLFEKAWNTSYRLRKKNEIVTFATKGKYLVNHTKHEFLDFSEYEQMCTVNTSYGLWLLQPLPLLTAVGNGLGGGDYQGVDSNYVGYWAGDQISIRDEAPKGYTKICPQFRVNFE